MRLWEAFMRQCYPEWPRVCWSDLWGLPLMPFWRLDVWED